MTRILIQLVGIIVIIIAVTSAGNIKKLKQIGLTGTFCLLMLVLIFEGFNYDGVSGFTQQQEIWGIGWFGLMKSSIRIGIDGVSIYFIVLSILLINVCILCGWESIRYRVKEYIMILMVTELLLVLVFSVLDILWFYILFEGLLIPMFLLIGMWGSRSRRIHAAYQFFFYTLCGSLLMLVGMILVYFDNGLTDMFAISELECSLLRRKCIWAGFFVALAIKIPMIPVHVWLPEAHVEAPTGGSVLLAGILLKLGGYGFLRFVVPMGEEVNMYFVPLIYTLSLVGILYTSCMAIRQVDLKKIIAYSSIGHMNYVTIGIFSQTLQGVSGAVFLMISHGLVSSGLFLSVGMIYERYKNRNILQYSGLIHLMPNFGVILMILILANMSFPGTSSFIGEFLVMVGVIKNQLLVVFISFFGMILSAIYSIWLYNRLMFGTINKIKCYCDLNKREISILIPLIIAIIFLGVKPMILLEMVELSLSKTINL
jgi:proton-translocating NADH-quinone oxidoreductase chain M